MMKKKLTILFLALTLSTNPLHYAPPTAATVHAKAEKVYIAPENGEKFHWNKDCRGLRNANRIEKLSKKNAKELGYTKCRICY